MNYFDVHITIPVTAYFSILFSTHRLTYDKKENKKLLNHDKIYVTPYVEIDIKL